MKAILKKARAILCFFLLFLCCLSGGACSRSKYSNEFSAEQISRALVGELGELSFAEYESTDISYMLERAGVFKECSVFYSEDSDDISEIGVFKFNTYDDAIAGEKSLEAYVEETREEKRAFVENYLPSQESKLEGARVRRYGAYVVYCILDAEAAEGVLRTAKELISAK